jgi:hypothetical protein
VNVAGGVVLFILIGVWCWNGTRSTSGQGSQSVLSSADYGGGDRPATVTTPVIYTAAQINATKNQIPTGTDLTISGAIYGVAWAPSTSDGNDPCSRLLAYGETELAHGEADPRDYCRYFVRLQDEDPRIGMGALVECNMSVEALRVVTSKYSYGEHVLAYGKYASSLDFVHMGGNTLGFAVLNNCVMVPEPSRPAPTVPPASPTPENIMRAINAEDSFPENRNKPYPVDADLESDVRRSLSTSKALKNAVITPVSLHREVTLSGTVSNESSRKLAESIAQYVPGVIKVHNNLNVISPQESQTQATQPRSGVLHYLGSPVPFGGVVVFDNLPNARLKFSFDRSAWQPTIKVNTDGTKTLTLTSLKQGYQTRCDAGWEILE